MMEPKLNLAGLDQYFGDHRHLFRGLIKALMPLHTDRAAVRFVPFIERYFVWGNDPGEAHSASPQPLAEPWVGVLHVPFDAPSWFEPSVSPETIFETELWRRSLPACLGVICLCEEWRARFALRYPDIPTLVVRHPTVLEGGVVDDVQAADCAAYQARPQVVQVGDWLRQLQAIFLLQAQGHRKLMLFKPYTQTFLEREMAALGDHTNDTVYRMDFVDDATYDDLLSRSVVLCLLHAAAANNVVLECLARRTPLLNNPLPSVVEYLGIDYPLFVSDVGQASEYLSDVARIRAAHNYLRDSDQRRAALTYSRFVSTVASSSWYAALPLPRAGVFKDGGKGDARDADQSARAGRS